MRLFFITTVAAFSLLVISAGAAVADVSAGGRIAQRWCSNCHVISNSQASAVPQGPPTFITIA
jgi:hypothetical protein